MECWVTIILLLVCISVYLINKTMVDMVEQLKKLTTAIADMHTRMKNSE